MIPTLTTILLLATNIEFLFIRSMHKINQWFISSLVSSISQQRCVHLAAHLTGVSRGGAQGARAPPLGSEAYN